VSMLLNLEVPLHILFMVGTYAVRVRRGMADSESDTVVGRAHLVPGHAVLAPSVRDASLWSHIAPGGKSHQFWPARRFGPKMQAWDINPFSDQEKQLYLLEGPDVSNITSSYDLDPSFPTIKNLVDDDESRQTRIPQKIRLNVNKVLWAWKRDAFAKQMQSVDRRDAKGELLMSARLMIIKNLLATIKRKRRYGHHIIGVAFGEASEENIQALASVQLLSENDEQGELRPMVYIQELVSTPNEEQKGAGRALVHGIILWAKETERLALIRPLNDKLQEYYKSLGFQPIDGGLDGFPNNGLDPGIMVYRGNLDEDRPTGGLLLDLTRPVEENTNIFLNS